MWSLFLFCDGNRYMWTSFLFISYYWIFLMSIIQYLAFSYQWCFENHTSFDLKLWGTVSCLLPLAAAGFESVYPGHLGGFHLSDITAAWFPYDFTQWLGTVKATIPKKNIKVFWKHYSFWLWSCRFPQCYNRRLLFSGYTWKCLKR